MVSNGFNTTEKQKAVVCEELKKYKIAALKSAKGAYHGCLFLMMADERCKPVKHFLHEGFLADK